MSPPCSSQRSLNWASCNTRQVTRVRFPFALFLCRPRWSMSQGVACINIIQLGTPTSSKKLGPKACEQSKRCSKPKEIFDQHPRHPHLSQGWTKQSLPPCWLAFLAAPNTGDKVSMKDSARFESNLLCYKNFIEGCRCSSKFHSLSTQSRSGLDLTNILRSHILMRMK